MPLSVLIADPFSVVRAGVRALLSGAGCRVVGACGNGREAVKLARKLSPGVVVMEAMLPELNGIDATRQMVDAGVKVLILSTEYDEIHVERALAAGVNGYVTKRSDASLATACKTVAGGKYFFSSDVEECARRWLAGKPSAALTVREMEVAQVVAEGFSNKEAGEKIGISQKTVEAHRLNLMNKLPLAKKDVVHLTAYLIRVGIISGR